MGWMVPPSTLSHWYIWEACKPSFPGWLCQTFNLSKSAASAIESAAEFVNLFETKRDTLRGTNANLEKQYADCKKKIDIHELKKLRDQLQKKFEDGDQTVIAQIQEINRRIKK